MLRVRGDGVGQKRLAGRQITLLDRRERGGVQKLAVSAHESVIRLRADLDDSQDYQSIEAALGPALVLLSECEGGKHEGLECCRNLV